MTALISANQEDIEEIASHIKLERCPRCDGLFFVNTVTGEKIEARCKAYSCDYCGPKKAWKLECALEKYFSQFKFVRLWTFDVRTSLFDNHKDGIFAISEVWRRFITFLRRNNALSSAQKKFTYVKVLEFTKRGYPHYHVLVNEFLPYVIVQACWENAINSTFKSNGTHGRAFVVASMQAKHAAKYVAKYVLKTSKDPRGKFRLWSKSNGASIFETKESSGEWIFLNMRKGELNLSGFSISSQLQPGSFRHFLATNEFFQGFSFDDDKYQEWYEEFNNFT
jgi:hypothetical protein